MTTGERRRQFRDLLARAAQWAEERADVLAVGVVGSWARGDERMDSDVDVVIVVEDVGPYVRFDGWAQALGAQEMTRTRAWGVLRERRFVTRSGLEVEAGFVPPEWARTDPVDAGTRRVATDGLRIVHDPHGLLAALRGAIAGLSALDGHIAESC